MAYVTVDVEIDEFDTDDLVKEICKRFKKTNVKNHFTNLKTQELIGFLNELILLLGVTPNKSINIRTLEDQMKYEHFASVFNKYNSQQIESMLP